MSLWARKSLNEEKYWRFRETHIRTKIGKPLRTLVLSWISHVLSIFICSEEIVRMIKGREKGLKDVPVHPQKEIF